MRNDVTHKIASLLRRAALALALATGCGLAPAGVIHVTIDTASFGAASGFIDMNLNATGAGPLATATVTNLVGFQGVPPADAWGVTEVAGGWRFRSDTSNDLFQSVDFGGLLSFDLSFAGAIDPTASFISKFVVSAFGSDGFTPLGHYDTVTGALAEFAWIAGGAAGEDGHVLAAISDPGVTAVPEPAPLLLIAIGCAALALTRRRAA